MVLNFPSYGHRSQKYHQSLISLSWIVLSLTIVHVTSPQIGAFGHEKSCRATLNEALWDF